MSQDTNVTKKEALDPIAEIKLMAEKVEEMCNSEEATKVFFEKTDSQTLENLLLLGEWATNTVDTLMNFLCAECIKKAVAEGKDVEEALKEMIKEMGASCIITSFDIPL